MSHIGNDDSPQKPISFVAKNNRCERLQSSSGGVFVLFATKIISEGGIVYGAAYDENLLVHHIGIDDTEKISMLMGSKYLQSRTEDVFEDIRTKLDSGKKVLYTGTACQVSGLKAFLKRDYPNLYTMDVLCHGVPSPVVWKKYLHSIGKKYQSEIVKALFRDKSSGWHNYSVTFSFANNTNFTEPFGKNVYMSMFLRNFILRPSCYDCKFKSLDRDSDITIGDAWGIEKILPEFDDDKGVSVIMLRTDKGAALFDGISQYITYENVDIDKILPKDSDARKSVDMPDGRALFFFLLKRGGSIESMYNSMSDRKIYKVLRKIIKNRK
ncbi:Coenzyme F420 hydrogenase/dehydrogenase, beta subunit C-terminal domain [Butyrivibrio sp. JL13D10]|uniref:Coenzyme F420 hydrogenase/dehydrogenase, beta subunit C-terminal domain n=1 Tax=Butyrivibrio sp. JL13D10 TaxID=3236815 RepID=UPI0038B4CDD3